MKEIILREYGWGWQIPKRMHAAARRVIESMRMPAQLCQGQLKLHGGANWYLYVALPPTNHPKGSSWDVSAFSKADDTEWQNHRQYKQLAAGRTVWDISPDG